MVAVIGSGSQRHLTLFPLTTIGAGFRGVFRVGSVEVFAVSFGNPLAPAKEHAPRCVGYGLGQSLIVFSLEHALDMQILNDNRIIPVVMKQSIGGLGNEVKTLACDNIMLLRESVFRLIVAFTASLPTRHDTLKIGKFLFRTLEKLTITNLFAIRGNDKRLCADIQTDSRHDLALRNVRHFTNDKAIPAPPRLFQRDLFRVSIKRTVHSDFHFTEFRHFQPIMAIACFTDRVLTDTFTCLEFVFPQTPRYRTDRPLNFGCPFLCFFFRVLHLVKKLS